MMMTFKQQPDQTNIPENWENAILYACIELGNAALMGADIPTAKPMHSAYVTLSVNSAEDAERIYGLLAEGGQIFIKMEETFFASRFAMLRDKFGTFWMPLHEKYLHLNKYSRTTFIQFYTNCRNVCGVIITNV